MVTKKIGPVVSGTAGKASSASSSRRGTMNSCLVKFEDGYAMVTSRNALKLATGDLFRLTALEALKEAEGPAD